jgi:hypothetical protein
MVRFKATVICNCFLSSAAAGCPLRSLGPKECFEGVMYDADSNDCRDDRNCIVNAVPASLYRPVV